MSLPRRHPSRLTAAMIRRSSALHSTDEAEMLAEEQVEEGGWRDDLKLFGAACLGGFVFFLVYLS